MSKAYETVRDFALPGSIVLVALIAAWMFRFAVVPTIGREALIQDRWTGGAEWCRPKSLGETICFPYLAANAKAAKKPPQAISDADFKRMMDRAESYARNHPAR